MGGGWDGWMDGWVTRGGQAAWHAPAKAKARQGEYDSRSSFSPHIYPGLNCAAVGCRRMCVPISPPACVSGARPDHRPTHKKDPPLNKEQTQKTKETHTFRKCVSWFMNSGASGSSSQKVYVMRVRGRLSMICGGSSGRRGSSGSGGARTGGALKRSARCECSAATAGKLGKQPDAMGGGGCEGRPARRLCAAARCGAGRAGGYNPCTRMHVPFWEVRPRPPRPSLTAPSPINRIHDAALHAKLSANTTGGMLGGQGWGVVRASPGG